MAVSREKDSRVVTESPFQRPGKGKLEKDQLQSYAMRLSITKMLKPKIQPSKNQRKIYNGEEPKKKKMAVFFSRNNAD